jgi:hypothetical protein
VTVSLHVWRVPPAKVPAALWRIAAERARLRRMPEVPFAKLLGTGRASRFGSTSGDPTRWAALTVADHPPAFPAWDRIATAACRLDLDPLHSRGTWAGRQPFDTPPLAARPDNGTGPVLALTRARLRPSRALGFWRAIGPVAGTLTAAPGLLAAFGIGEAPLGWQGTISVWRCAADLVRFAYRQPEHRLAITRTAAVHWYAEELFARFAVLSVHGDSEVIGWFSRKPPPG